LPQQPHNFQFPTTSNNSMADARNCEVEATLAPLNFER